MFDEKYGAKVTDAATRHEFTACFAKLLTGLKTHMLFAVILKPLLQFILYIVKFSEYSVKIYMKNV